MIMSLRLGTNDVAKARAFYDAIVQAIGGTPTPAKAISRSTASPTR